MLPGRPTRRSPPPPPAPPPLRAASRDRLHALLAAAARDCGARLLWLPAQVRVDGRRRRRGLHRRARADVPRPRDVRLHRRLLDLGPHDEVGRTAPRARLSATALSAVKRTHRPQRARASSNRAPSEPRRYARLPQTHAPRFFARAHRSNLVFWGVLFSSRGRSNPFESASAARRAATRSSSARCSSASSTTRGACRTTTGSRAPASTRRPSTWTTASAPTPAPRASRARRASCGAHACC